MYHDGFMTIVSPEDVYNQDNKNFEKFIFSRGCEIFIESIFAGGLQM